MEYDLATVIERNLPDWGTRYTVLGCIQNLKTNVLRVGNHQVYNDLDTMRPDFSVCNCRKKRSMIAQSIGGCKAEPTRIGLM